MCKPEDTGVSVHVCKVHSLGVAGMHPPGLSELSRPRGAWGWGCPIAWTHWFL